MEGDPYNHIPVPVLRTLTPPILAGLKRGAFMDTIEFDHAPPPSARGGWKAERPLRIGETIWKYGLLWRAASGLNGDVVLHRV